MSSNPLSINGKPDFSSARFELAKLGSLSFDYDVEADDTWHLYHREDGHSLGRVYFGDQGEIIGIESLDFWQGMPIVVQLANLVNMLHVNSYSGMGYKLTMRPNGDIIEVTISEEVTTDECDDFDMMRLTIYPIAQFDFHPATNKLTQRGGREPKAEEVPQNQVTDREDIKPRRRSRNKNLPRRTRR